MGKNLTSAFAALTAIGLLATSCSNEADPIISNNPATYGTEFTLSLNDKGDNALTRSARDLYSSAAANNVDEVQLKLFEKISDSYAEATGCEFLVNEVALSGGKLSWSAGPKDQAAGTIGGDGSVSYDPERKASQTISIKGLKANTTYKVVAYGYEKDITTAVEFTADAAVFTPNAGSEVEEIFAGEKEFTTNDKGKVADQPEVVLNRQVAGFLGYFENIPTHVGDNDVKGVRVVAVASSASYKNSTLKQNQNSAGADNVTIYDMKIDNTNPTLANLDASGTTFKFQQNISGVYVKPNAVLGGKFLVAFAKSNSAATFKVELYDAQGETLKSWNVKNGATTDYDVNRNEFYMIGKKYTIGKPGTDPDNPDNPDPDPENPEEDPENPDEPVDLHNAQDILVTVVDAWDVIHNLELE